MVQLKDCIPFYWIAQNIKSNLGSWERVCQSQRKEWHTYILIGAQINPSSSMKLIRK